jgi:hypothetical protein
MDIDSWTTWKPTNFGVDEQRGPKVHRTLCVLCEQTGAAKCLRVPLAASALDVATVPAPPHTRRRPQHSLGRVRLGVDEQRGPKVHRTLCVLREQTGAAKCLRGPLEASALDVGRFLSHIKRRHSYIPLIFSSRFTVSQCRH